ncbi:MAG: ABC transporter substrate-binding protein [Actinomycetota bacterium]
MSDRRFRQAVAYAIDRKDIVRRLLGGMGEPGNPGYLPKSHPYHADVEQYEFSRQKANRLLDEIGYKRQPGSKERKGPDGAKLRFELLAPPINGPLIELVVAQLKEVGITIDVKPVENFMPYGAMPKGEFEMTIVVYGNPGGDPDRLREVYSSRIPDSGRLPFAAYGYSDPELDDFADRQLIATDEAERKRLIGRMQEIAARDVPFLHLLYPQPILIYRDGIFDGLSIAKEGGGPFSKDFFVTGKRPGRPGG